MIDVFTSYDVNYPCQGFTSEQTRRSTFDDFNPLYIRHGNTRKIEVPIIAANHWLPINHNHGITAVETLHLQTYSSASRANIVNDSQTCLLF
ncbi:hypothetical protein D3C78_1540710 [compost metagenome]